MISPRRAYRAIQANVAAARDARVRSYMADMHSELSARDRAVSARGWDRIGREDQHFAGLDHDVMVARRDALFAGMDRYNREQRVPLGDNSDPREIGR